MKSPNSRYRLVFCKEYATTNFNQQKHIMVLQLGMGIWDLKFRPSQNLKDEYATILLLGYYCPETIK